MKTVRYISQVKSESGLFYLSNLAHKPIKRVQGLVNSALVLSFSTDFMSLVNRQQ